MSACATAPSLSLVPMGPIEEPIKEAFLGFGNRLHGAVSKIPFMGNSAHRSNVANSFRNSASTSPLKHTTGVTRRGAAGAGALIGGGLGFLAPGTDEEGNTKSRFNSALSGAATGGMLGAGAGHIVKGQTNKALTDHAKTMSKTDLAGKPAQVSRQKQRMEQRAAPTSGQPATDPMHSAGGGSGIPGHNVADTPQMGQAPRVEDQIDPGMDLSIKGRPASGKIKKTF